MNPCLALTSILWQGITSTKECSMMSLDVAGRGYVDIPSTGIGSNFLLHRGGIGLGLVQGDLQGRVQIGHIQTGGTNSYIGIGGESNVYRIQMAEVRYRPVDSLRLSAGIVEDFWVESGNRAWGLRNIEATSAEEFVWMERGNVGVSATWSTERVVLATSLHTGEGAFRRERNPGKSTSFYARVDILKKEKLYLEVYGQDGSFGFGSARNHRVGGRLSSSFIHSTTRVGMEGLKTWGIRGNSAYAPLLLSGWASIDPTEWTRVITRLEHIQLNDVSSQAVLIGVAKPIDTQGNLGIYWKTWTNDSTLLPISGASAAIETHRVIVQLDGRFEIEN